MIGVHAGWVFTLVMEYEVLRDFAIGFLVKIAVSSYWSISSTDIPVTAGGGVMLPDPALSFVAAVPRYVIRPRTDANVSTVVAVDKPKGLSLHMTKIPAGALGKGRLLSTAAHTQAAGVRGRQRRLSALMTNNVLMRLAAYVTAFLVALRCKIGLLSTTAPAVAKRDIRIGLPPAAVLLWGGWKRLAWSRLTFVHSYSSFLWAALRGVPAPPGLFIALIVPKPWRTFLEERPFAPDPRWRAVERRMYEEGYRAAQRALVEFARPRNPA